MDVVDVVDLVVDCAVLAMYPVCNVSLVRVSPENDLAFLDAIAQAELVRTGQASPKELVAAAIERIEAMDGRLNAVVHRRYEQALAEASGELPDGPFRGVPLLLKDLSGASKGDPLTFGSRVLKEAGYRSDHDSFLAAAFRRAGFVVVGRTNVPELGATVTTEPEAYGPCRNPWNTEHSTGGSSGGSAAAVAAGMVPVAHANDGGGSIRIPASACGLVGLKPTRGRVSLGPDYGEMWAGLAGEGVVTRTVRDTAGVLDTVAGPKPGDPYSAPPLRRPLAAEVGADPGRLRVGFLAEPAIRGLPGHPECRAAVENTAALLGSLGHQVADDAPSALGDRAFAGNFGMIVSAHTAATIAGWEEQLGTPVAPEALEPDNRRMLEAGRAIGAADYLRAEHWLAGFTRRMAAWWTPADDGGAGFDLLLTPTLNMPPPPLGWLRPDDAEEAARRLLRAFTFAPQANVTGQPAISLPLHWSADGLPVGVQLTAAQGREDVLVRVASQLEAARPWADRRPTVDHLR